MQLTVSGYHHRHEMFDRFTENIRRRGLRRTSFDLLALGITQQQAIENAVQRAMEVCETGGLPLEDNFRHIYVAGLQGLMPAWELSETAFRLTLLNADTHNPAIAHMQLALMGVSRTA